MKLTSSPAALLLSFVLALALALAVSGCTTGNRVNAGPGSLAHGPQEAGPAATAREPAAVHWYRDSAERPMIYEEIYRQATAAARTLSAGESPGSWGVILDVDETILDNSGYEARLADAGQSYSDASWDAWVHERKSGLLPGAAAFIRTVRDQLHGRVVLVTNREQSQCADTEGDLKLQHVHYDAILCAPNGPDGKPVFDKNPRFSRVQAGEVPGVGPIRVLLYLGDNIEDFPELSQAHPGEPTRFGTDYFLLPNPMYGSWVGNAAH